MHASVALTWHMAHGTLLRSVGNRSAPPPGSMYDNFMTARHTESSSNLGIGESSTLLCLPYPVFLAFLGNSNPLHAHLLCKSDKVEGRELGPLGRLRLFSVAGRGHFSKHEV